MELTDYNTTFVHIKVKSNVLADAISRSKILNIYKELLENPRTQPASYTYEHIMEVCTTDIHNISTTMLHTDQRWGIMYKTLASQLCSSNKK